MCYLALFLFNNASAAGASNAGDTSNTGDAASTNAADAKITTGATNGADIAAIASNAAITIATNTAAVVNVGISQMHVTIPILRREVIVDRSLYLSFLIFTNDFDNPCTVNKYLLNEK